VMLQKQLGNEQTWEPFHLCHLQILRDRCGEVINVN
jgi:hypothetical protein